MGATSGTESESGKKTPRRVVLCIGEYCNARRQADVFYERLQSLLGTPNPFSPKYPDIKWTAANCLDRCEQAPNLVIYPDGIWCHHLDADSLEQIIKDEIAPLIPENHPQKK